MNDSEQNKAVSNRFVYTVILITLALTMVPYLIGQALANNRIYMWLGYNLDDSCVYLSWMRQAVHGSIWQYNLFSTSPQHPMLANPLFWCLGLFAGITHLPMLAVYHLARLTAGFALLFVVWKLIREMLQDTLAQKTALLFVCFSAGLGWLPGLWPQGGISIMHTPIDAWQPEAVTFLSLYLSPLFAFSMLLQVSVQLLLWKSIHTNSMKDALLAGILVTLLGLTHTYDVVGLALTWVLFLVFLAFTKTNATLFRKACARVAMAAAAGLPGVAVIAWELHTDALFNKRAAVPTLSAPIAYILIGYGLIFLLALFVPVHFLLHNKNKAADADRHDSTSLFRTKTAALLIILWALAQLLAAYLPVAFQRKMLQGEHFPLAIMAAAGTVWLLRLPRSPLRQKTLFPAVIALTTLLSISNIRFLTRDVLNDQQNIVQTFQQRPYLKPGEWKAIQWVKKHIPAKVAIQPMPWVQLSASVSGKASIAARDMTIACFLPGLTAHPVYCGHWGETPSYPHKLQQLQDFALPSTTDAQRIALLKKMKVGYLLFSQKDSDDPSADQLAPMFRDVVSLPPYLEQIYSNRDVNLYKITSLPIGRSM